MRDRKHKQCDVLVHDLIKHIQNIMDTGSFPDDVLVIALCDVLAAATAATMMRSEDGLESMLDYLHDKINEGWDLMDKEVPD